MFKFKLITYFKDELILIKQADNLLNDFKMQELTMIVKNQTIALLLTVPLLAAIISIGNMTYTEAATIATQQPGPSPKAYGLNTDVCGDKLCSEVNSSTKDKTLEIVDIYPLSGDHYKLLIKAESGMISPLVQQEVIVTSDTTTRILSVPFINTNSHDYVSTTIKAFNSESIEVSYSPEQIVNEIQVDGPRVFITDISNISNQDNVYRVIFDVTSKHFDAKNIKIQVSSDSDSFYTTIGGLSEDTTQSNHVIMKISNPQTVTAQVVDFEVNR